MCTVGQKFLKCSEGIKNQICNFRIELAFIKMKFTIIHIYKKFINHKVYHISYRYVSVLTDI